MAATDKNYRNQKTLDIVFAVSCVLMLFSIIWMFEQDYNREFKHEQRVFRDVEDAQAARAMLEKIPDAAAVKQADEEATKARAALELAKREAAPAIHKLQVAKAQQEAAYQSTKADYDSVMSLRDIAVDTRDDGPPDERKSLEASVEKRATQVQKLRDKLIEAQRKLEATETEIKQKQQDQKAAEEKLSRAEDNLKKVASEFDRWAKLAAQKSWKWHDTVRDLPVLDAFASPIRIQQYTLAEYPIDYSFKYVTRYDRCTTCHLGIDRPAFDKKTLRGLTPESTTQELQTKLDGVIASFTARASEKTVVKGPDGTLKVLWPGDKKADGDEVVMRVPGEQLGFDPSHLSQEVKTVELGESRINEFCAHPRLDLFVEANSPHPAEKFGCTSCHSGQGSSTDFAHAAHAPNSAEQRQAWIKEHDWESSHFWDYPMLPKRFIESTCLKCHHQVMDLIRYGNKAEAPKLLKGYNLVRESGCFGCHEISGIKSGREVGPDLRLEPSPPLEAYTPIEQTKMLSDPLNPPGKMRKVGPSLLRLIEKTNQQWTRTWIMGPREFRPTTRMPHFYGVSNNREDVLPEDQQGFPEAEVASISYYLFRESKDYLGGQDRFRKAYQARLKQIGDKKQANLASESELKLFDELTRRPQLDQPPTPLRDDHLIDSEGKVFSLPPAGDAKTGRQLFTERGCLACHSHDATKTAGQGLPAVASEAEFGPDLSRLAAKIAPESSPADPSAKRRWLVQWILDPNIHFPRAHMPITHLTSKEAADVAAWLLEQPATGWDQKDVADPKPEVLGELARVYILKAPGMTRQDVDEILSGQPNERKGLASVKHLPLDADERELEGPLTDDRLKWYVGRKAITRLGCFGCHEIPGFATAKPIGTPLNDWGKKDPERLAFEDIVAYVKDHSEMVDQLTDAKGHGLVAEKGQKQPYDRFFFEALEHHQREGFLNQKLIEPRSYDYHRLRTWDDRLRMPQFQFARKIQPKEGETYEQAKAREEADGREAVMTFILGLVAEPVPTKYLNDPSPDRLAEVKGRHVLEKYNCAGCHQIRSGVYEILKPDEEMEPEYEPPSGQELTPGQKLMQRLDNAFFRASRSNTTQSDHVFPEHNAWTGQPSPLPDRLMVYGIPSPPPQGEELNVRLTQALGFTRAPRGQAKQVKQIPAGETVYLSHQDLIAHAEPFGGTFANLIVHSRYLTQRSAQDYPTLEDGESPDSRKALPPPLLREGEKTQPGWLFQFLRNPIRIRPAVMLRMPRFNMSADEAMDLVNYFGAADRLNNPGIGLTYPYLSPMPQREEGFWGVKSHDYLQDLKKKDLVQARENALKPLWDLFYAEALGQAEAAVKAAQAAETKATGDQKKAAEDARKEAEKQLADLKNQAAFEKTQRTDWQENQAYASDAYRLLANYNRCLNCHKVGPQRVTQPIGPPLELAPDRLRPDWLQRWIASPQRLLIYPEGPHAMPTNFKKTDPPWPEFAGSMFEQATAVRDVLINYPKIADLPVNRLYRSSAGENK
jgi:mono/diheme cytochrome c family protein